MALSKQQFDELGITLYKGAAAPGYNEEYFAVKGGVQHQLDPSTARALESAGVSLNVITDRTKGIPGISTSGGNTVNDAFLSNEYAQIAARRAQEGEQARVDAQNKAGGFYVGAPQIGDSATAAAAEAAGTAARNALLPAGTVPGQASPEAIAKYGPKVEEVPGVGTLTTTPKKTTPTTPAPTDPNVAGLYARTGVQTPPALTVIPAQPTNANNTVFKDASNNVFKADGTPIDLATFKAMGLNIDHINLRPAGTPGQATVGTATPPQPTNANNTVYKDAQGNVFKLDGTPIDQKTFQSMGLNIDHINTKQPPVYGGGSGDGSGGSNGGQPGTPGQPGTATPATTVTKAYQLLQDQLTQIEAALIASKTKSPEEQKLLQDLNNAKTALAKFDTETLARAESYSGQGRGATLGTVAQNQAKDARTRALQRLGLAQDAENLIGQVNLAQQDRQQAGETAQIQFQIANARLDASLGLTDRLENLDEKEQKKAREYLLDVIDFSAGKTFDELDGQAQQAIINATANSPITLDMVKTALEKGAAPEDLDTSVVEVNGIKKLINNQTGETIKVLGSADNPSDGTNYGNRPIPVVGTETDPTILAYARQYASTGTIPTGIPKNSFARIAEAARNLPKQPGTLYDANTGIKSSAISQAAQDGVAALSESLTKMREAQTLRELYSSTSGVIERTKIKTQYDAIRKDVAESLLRAASGGAVTEQEAEYYAGLMPTTSIFNINPTVKAQQAIDNVETKLNSKLATYGLKLAGYNDGAAQYDE